MGGYAESVHRQLDHGESSEEQYHLVVYLHDEHGYRWDTNQLLINLNICLSILYT